ncbi:hypothetical protein [Leucobacter sp. USHLN153]|uniref:hypothetical protein n=1 Tax=Leucobacter sp. USHLN153 TaxID=3081268 RepID=UPI00301956BD
MTTHTRMPETVSPRPVATLRTPYHSLSGADEMLVPEWAQRRSVYRSSGRTLYLVETDRLSDARRDLKRLDRAGWDVRVATADEADHARIAFTRRDLAQAA